MPPAIQKDTAGCRAEKKYFSDKERKEVEMLKKGMADSPESGEKRARKGKRSKRFREGIPVFRKARKKKNVWRKGRGGRRLRNEGE